MARLVLVALVFLVIKIMQKAQAQNTCWATRDDTGKEVVTTLKFYFHDILGGSSPTAVKVAQTTKNNTSSTGFGTLMMVDDPLTEGPESTSKPVGRARGLYGLVGQAEISLIMVLTYEFTDDIYSGSSFSLLSYNPVLNPIREMAIVGGTGIFRFARGYAIAQTYSLNPTNGDTIVGYNVTIATYI